MTIQETTTVKARMKRAHIFPADKYGHYVDPFWCSQRLFDVEAFDQTIWDPSCGWGRIPKAAIAAGYHVIGSDIVDRGAADKVPGLSFRQGDFLSDPPIIPTVPLDGGKFSLSFPFSIVANPPFGKLPEFVDRALGLGARKVAFIWRMQRIAAALWLRDTPLARIYLMNPRPSMPPGNYIEAGGKVGGGGCDYAWLIFERGYVGKPEVSWLLRDVEDRTND